MHQIIKLLLFIAIHALFVLNAYNCLYAQDAGSPDTGFADLGYLVVQVGDDFSWTRDMAVQEDGKIILGGSSKSNGIVVFTMVRFNFDGTFDNSFGLGGIVQTQIGMQSGIDALVLQADGKIVAAGTTVTNSGIFDVSVARYNIDGALDITFGNSGVTTVNVENNFNVEGIAIQSNGKIVVSGYSGQELMPVGISHVRFNTDGSVDNTFGVDGLSIVKFQQSHDVEAWSMTLDADDNILTAGAIYDLELMRFHIAVARFGSDGTLDNSFGDGGVLVTSFLDDDEFGNDIVVQPDGKILVVASVTQGAILVRYNNDGSLDESFGSGARVTVSFNDGNTEVYSVLTQSDGKIIVAGVSGTNAQNTNGNYGLARFHNDGTIDTGFGVNGSSVTDVSSGHNDVAFKLRLCPDGKIAASGVSYDGTHYNMSVARFFSTSTGINPLKSNDLMVFPNPADTYLTFLGDDDCFSTQPFETSIYDRYGKIVGVYSLLNGETPLQVSEIPNGVYLLKVKLNTRVLSKKIVIIHP